MPDPEINVSALLRLKRYEQPPPGYFDRLLQEVHRRQRTELLRRPLWKIALDRFQTFFSEHSMSGLSYAGAMAAILVVGVAAIGLVTPNVERSPVQNAAVAEAGTPARTTPNLLSLQPRLVKLPALEATQLQPSFAPPGDRTNRPPRYVIDARPVSYDLPPSL